MIATMTDPLDRLSPQAAPLCQLPEYLRCTAHPVAAEAPEPPPRPPTAPPPAHPLPKMKWTHCHPNLKGQMRNLNPMKPEELLLRVKLVLLMNPNYQKSRICLMKPLARARAQAQLQLLLAAYLLTRLTPSSPKRNKQKTQKK
ncbi:hypothetical protein RIF29_39513 [Crotalaria pallida]|uniref:Uncharacterized protein n=1 Tax=Crotalaria pallida TaxID=3830 RepID=A0AAN9E4D3_CROPI